MVVFHEPKHGSSEQEWEDGAGHDPGDPRRGRAARCVVVDGATEAYDAIRWVGQLVESFLGFDPAGGRPSLTPAAMDAWFGVMQERWVQNAPATFATIYEERKFHDEGSFATLLGCEITGLDGHRPRWEAVALGDCVLFHVRGTRVVQQFPDLAPTDFGTSPDGVFTQPAARDSMRARLDRAEGVLEIGDRLFLASDALAQWMAASSGNGSDRLWRQLGVLDHPGPFRKLVARERGRGVLKNDDVTLLRVEITASDPSRLVVCR